jgi:hypothetical protein
MMVNFTVTRIYSKAYYPPDVSGLHRISLRPQEQRLKLPRVEAVQPEDCNTATLPVDFTLKTVNQLLMRIYSYATCLLDFGFPSTPNPMEPGP